jgi:hypothetical protein
MLRPYGCVRDNVLETNCFLNTLFCERVIFGCVDVEECFDGLFDKSRTIWVGFDQRFCAVTGRAEHIEKFV